MAILGSEPWHSILAVFYSLKHFWACMHSPLSLGKGSSSTSLSGSPCSSQWSVCSPAAVWGEWGVTRSASATPSAPPASGLMYTGPRTDTAPAPSTCKDKLCAELLLKTSNKLFNNKTKQSVTISANHEITHNTKHLPVTASPVWEFAAFFCFIL